MVLSLGNMLFENVLSHYSHYSRRVVVGGFWQLSRSTQRALNYFKIFFDQFSLPQIFLSRNRSNFPDQAFDTDALYDPQYGRHFISVNKLIT